MDADATSSRVLLESVRALWPRSEWELTRRPRRDAPSPCSRDYLLVPHSRAPVWLLPSDGPHTGVAPSPTGGGVLRRGAGSALALAHRQGLTSQLPLRRLRVRDPDTDSLLGHLARQFDAEVQMAVRLGSWGQARSLVVRVFSPDGTTLAFGKAGLDEHGKSAVRAEISALRRAHGAGLRHTRVPRLLADGQWEGINYLFVSPLLPGASPRATEAAYGLPLDAMDELFALGSRSDLLTGSGWFRDATARLSEITDPTVAAVLASARDSLVRAEAVPLPLGAWHGDWTPWNMTYEGSTVLLWDWEHFAEDVPIGFDPLHHLAQTLRRTRGSTTTHEQEWRRRATSVLADHLSLNPVQQGAVLVAYLLEVNLRFILDRQNSAEHGRRRDGWGISLLREETRRFSGHG